ncbi:MAG: ribosylpyrimidine nucleosidase [Oscillospiraceae bacterium]|nr:ribosylpyrimidine nucleosidase [Oscillospiraceae bacterium]
MQKIILDCDPGHDDAVALIMAAKHPKIELLGITTSAGNQTVEKTSRNALHLCQHLGLDVPVYKGMRIPMVREQEIADSIHGDTGLDGPVFAPLTRMVEPKHAVQFIIDTILASDGDVTLVPTGPLTNIAMAMRYEPDIVPKIKEIVLMGGAYQLGNWTAAAEFNIYVDAEAAYVVFTSGVPIVMMGLEVTNTVLCTGDTVTRMEKIGNTASKLFADMMHFFLKTNKEVFDMDGGPLHDPVTIAWLIDPSCVTLKEMYTEIEIRSNLCYGRTVCDYFGMTKKPPNSRVAVGIDQEKFWDIVESCLRLY